MDFHINIRLRPDPEFPVPILMGALFGKLHRVLVAMEADNIGVSFPGYSVRSRGLGDILRLHGNAPALDKLMSQTWLSGMWDHIAMGDMAEVPSQVKHCCFRRRQFKTNAERLRRRRARRHGETLEQARVHIPDSVERRVSLPFVTLRSLSTGERFCLFIERGEAQLAPRAGMFNRYGLSQGATVPWF
jgi:CRISPR-associated endonuclease Csy4